MSLRPAARPAAPVAPVAPAAVPAAMTHAERAAVTMRAVPANRVASTSSATDAWFYARASEFKTRVTLGSPLCNERTPVSAINPWLTDYRNQLLDNKECPKPSNAGNAQRRVNELKRQLSSVTNKNQELKTQVKNLMKELRSASDSCEQQIKEVETDLKREHADEVQDFEVEISENQDEIDQLQLQILQLEEKKAELERKAEACALPKLSADL